MAPDRVLLACIAMELGACTSVLGLDPPTLDRCASGGCADAHVDGATDASKDGVEDAHEETARPSAPVPCGGGSFAMTTCPKTQDCCQATGEAGTAYACVDGGACPGFVIDCSSNADCPGADVCCDVGDKVGCIGPSACAPGSLLCDPSGPASQCQAGWSCTGIAVLAGVASPYAVCAKH